MTDNHIPSGIRDLLTEITSTIFENLCSHIPLEFALNVNKN